MRPIIFRCPVTRENVQHMLDDSEFVSDDDQYEAVGCLACSQIHFVNKATGKLFGEE